MRISFSKLNPSLFYDLSHLQSFLSSVLLCPHVQEFSPHIPLNMANETKKSTLTHLDLELMQGKMLTTNHYETKWLTFKVVLFDLKALAVIYNVEWVVDGIFIPHTYPSMGFKV